MNTDTLAFIEQNDIASRTLTYDDVDGFARHHSGGLYVLIADAGLGHVVKMHDSWGDDGKVVVHVYHPDFDSDRESESYFVNGMAALTDFRSKVI